MNGFNKRKLLSIIAVTIIILALPLTLILVKHQNEIRTRAAAPDQLEAEGGVLGGNAKIQTDSLASGGNYVALGTNQTPTPTPITQTGTTYTVPSTIDKTGATDVSSALNNWIASLPNGTAANPTNIVFPSGAVYKLGAGGSIFVNNRSYLVFSGYGATIKATGGGNVTDSAFIIGNSAPSHDIKIKGFTLIGANPDGGTPYAYHVGAESQMGIELYSHPGAYNIEIFDNTITDMYGHGGYVRSDSPPYPDNINIHNNVFRREGLMGWAFTNGTNLKFNDNQVYDSGLTPLDFEDGSAGEPLQHVQVERNLFDTWEWWHPVSNISSMTATNPSTVTTSSPHHLASGQEVAFFGHSGITNGWKYGAQITVINATQFTIPIQGTAGSGGTVEVWFTPHVISGDGGTGMIWNDFLIDSNIMRHGSPNPTNMVGAQDGQFSFWGSDTKTNFTVTNNVSELPVEGWANRFQSMSTFNFTHNTFPGISGGATDEVAHIVNITNVISAPNP